MRRFFNNVHDDRGAVAAEFALVLPMLVLLVFGIVQFGLTFQRQEAVHAAAREGARIASLPSTSPAEACARSSAALTGTGFTATPACAVVGDCSNSTGNVVVTITVANTLEIPFFPTQTFDLTGRGEFRCE